MSTPRPDRTIDDIFAEFLAAQEARLSSKTYARYEGIIDLYRGYLERYWPGHSREDCDAVTRAGGTYCGTYGAADIASGFSEFLGYFMPHKVIAGNETMKAAGTVVNKLTRWLAARGYTEVDEAARGRVREAARDLPASQKLLDALNDWIEATGPARSGKEIEGHFVIQRVEPKQIWLESLLGGDSEIGPIPVPAAIARACKVGWDIGGVVARTARGWRLVEIWNISP
ncbi:hypothetical protein [Aquisphaera insulae]|uniref:hypothetical protein n=1 Tax=Aquisphaera insulae TaxID=2712864 RepID=UPI0013EE032B|nr:hypothetical protein [Aquisphaera insulae]